MAIDGKSASRVVRDAASWDNDGVPNATITVDAALIVAIDSLTVLEGHLSPRA